MGGEHKTGILPLGCKGQMEDAWLWVGSLHTKNMIKTDSFVIPKNWLPLGCQKSFENDKI